MAAYAGCGQPDLARRLHVTALAGDSSVRPSQRKAETRMVEIYRAPVRGLVTRRAIAAVAALVNVILRMASEAGHGRTFYSLALAVTLDAGCGAVRAGQREARVTRVVEIHELPAGRHVAAFAFGTLRPFVDIVLKVAGDAGSRRSLEDAIGMAALAGDLAMFAKQVEAGDRMVEFARVGPFRGSVAPFAFLSQTAVVLVILFVAGDTGRWSRPEGLRRFVAALAFDLSMRAGQREVGQSVVESVLFEGSDIEPGALVVGMARSAGRPGNLGRLPVEAEALVDVRRHIFVTRETAVVLLSGKEGHMAGEAIVFDLGMGFRKRAGRDEFTDERHGQIRCESGGCDGRQDQDDPLAHHAQK